MKLTKNFSKSEFDSKDGACMPNNVLEKVVELAKNIQIIRDNLNAPIVINSGYRSPSHNKKVGGVSNSQHLLGIAADLNPRGKTPRELYNLIDKLIREKKIKEGGLGLYKTFVHYDIRGNKARWDYS